MKSIIRNISAAAVVCVAATASQAATFSWSFEIESLSGSYTGKTNLTVSADNGGSSDANQSFLNTQITAVTLELVDNGLMYSLNNVDNTQYFSGIQSYITTDSMGIATLDLSAYSDSKSVLVDKSVSPSDYIQLGTRDNSGPTQFSFRFGDFNGRNWTDIVTSTAPAIAAVPLPAAGFLLLGGLGALGALRRRKKAA